MANVDHLEMFKLGVKAWNIWREENPDILPDLSGSILSETRLSGVSKPVEPANLKKINFSKTNLASTILRGADLCNASLLESNLKGADLRRANLNNVDASRAIFHLSNLTLTKFRFANLTNAQFWETVLSRVDLTGAIGLDTCRHGGPSVIDGRTFKNSGDLPVEFLRGCGLSDWEIEATKLNKNNLSSNDVNNIIYKIHDIYLSKPIDYYSCFISYSHSDHKFVKKLYSKLQNKGIRCWLDEHQIFPGDDIRDEIDRGINIWDKVLLCCSKASLNSYWVNAEIDKALNKEERLWKTREQKVFSLIPINLDGYLFQWENSRASELKKRHAENFLDWHNDSSFNRAINRIETALRADENAREKPPKPKL